MVHELNSEILERFADWLNAARASPSLEPTAMHLATVDEKGRPSCRVVLLKGFDEQGFVFYTNLGSPKARHIAHRGEVALTWYWPEIERQVRAEGSAEPVGADEADTYFASRARGSQIGAWASQQSSALSHRDELERRVAEYEKKFANRDVPRPDFWSGFRVRPRAVEFWRAGSSRLHERERFAWKSGQWERTLLFP